MSRVSSSAASRSSARKKKADMFMIVLENEDFMVYVWGPVFVLLPWLGFLIFSFCKFSLVGCCNLLVLLLCPSNPPPP